MCIVNILWVQIVQYHIYIYSIVINMSWYVILASWAGSWISRRMAVSLAPPWEPQPPRPARPGERDRQERRRGQVNGRQNMIWSKQLVFIALVIQMPPSFILPKSQAKRVPLELQPCLRPKYTSHCTRLTHLLEFALFCAKLKENHELP